MDIKIVTQAAFAVVGLPHYGKNEHEEIPELWTDLGPRMDEIADKTGPAYGLCMPVEAWTVPEQTYAVFPCELSTIHEAYRYAFESWLPQSDYRHDQKGIDFELYTEEFDQATGDEGMYVYVPVVTGQ